MKYTFFITTLLFVSSLDAALKSLSDDEMNDVGGQAGILNVSRFDFNGNNFYRLQANADIQTSVNIDKLLLTDGSGNPDVDIDNFSLSGGLNNQVSSANITNPYIEFAFAGNLANDDITDREFIGVRFGADGIDGVLSFGERDNSNLANQTGINTISGYVTTEDLTGIAGTAAVNDRGNFTVSGNLDTSFGPGSFTSTDSRFTFPAINVPFTSPGVVINDTDVSSIFIETNPILLPDTGFTVNGNAQTTIQALGFIPLTLDIELRNAPGTIRNLRVQGEVTEDLSFLHRSEVSGADTYLSFQNRAIKWSGSPGDASNPATNDIAQPGWWLSIADPLSLDPIALTGVVIPDATLSGIAGAASDFLLTPGNEVQVSLGDAFAGLVGVPISPDVGLIDLDTLPSNDPIPLPLTNVDLGASQEEVRNCWNGALSC